MKDNIYSVYIHINKINNKSYIGLTSCQPPSLRWGGGSHYKNQYFYHAINKYGWDNFEHIIWATNLTYDEANHLEFLLIQLFNTDSREYGYNIDKGGNSIGKHSKETKLKIKQNHADFSGANHPMYGKHHSEKTKQKIREKALGRKHSQKQKEEMSIKFSGAGNPRAKRVQCLETQQIFETAKEAAKWCGRDVSTLCKNCNGKTSYCGFHPVTGEKLHWIYILEDKG